MKFAANTSHRVQLGALVLGLGLAVFAGCSKEEKTKGQSESTAVACATGSGSASAALTDCAANGSGSASGSASAAPPAETDASLGLFDYCKWAVNDTGGCMTCTPRDLDLLKCSKDVKAGFDPAKNCKHDIDKQTISCEMGSGDEFSWSFGEESKTEKLYAELPLILAGAKLFFASKITNDPAKKEVVLGALDVLGKHSKGLFNGDDVGPAAKEIAALAKKVRPNISDAELASVTSQVTKAINTISEKRKAGEFQDGDMLNLLAGFVTALPPDVIGNEVGGLDVGTLAQGLGGNSGDLSGLIGLLGGSLGTGSGSGSASANGSGS